METYSYESFSGTLHVKIDYTVDQDIATNKSTIGIDSIWLRTTGSDRRPVWATGSVSINGETCAKLILDNVMSCGAYLSAEFQKIVGSGMQLSPVVVSHMQDGTADMFFGGTLSFTITSKPFDNIGGVMVDNTVALPRIPRVSSITANPVILGNQMSINIERSVDLFADTISYSCGSESGTIVSKTTNSVVTWTPPVNLAAQSVSTDYAEVTLIVQTYVDDVSVGTGQITVRCPLPDSIVPTVSTNIVDVSGHKEKYGAYVQGKSNVNVVSTYSGIQGSTIESISVTCGSVTKAGVVSQQGTTISIGLTEYGDVHVITKVTDSRGRIAISDDVVTVNRYAPPEVKLTAAYRCSADGTKQADGDHVTVVFTADISSLYPENGYDDNTPKYYVRFKGAGENAWSVYPITNIQESAKFNPRSAFFIVETNTDKTYDFSIEATDDFDSKLSTYITVPVAFALMDYDRTNRAIGFGQRANVSGALSIGMQVDMHEHIIGNLLDPIGLKDAATKEYVDQKVKDIMDILLAEFGLAPRIISQPRTTRAVLNTEAYFNVIAAGVGLTYQWQYKRKDGVSWINATASIPGYNTNAIRPLMTGEQNGRTYRCVITDSDGNIVTSDEAGLFFELAVTQHPTNQTVAAGETAEFTIRASGASISYWWQYKDTYNGTWQNTTSATEGYNKSTLRPVGASIRNGYQYRCVVTGTDELGNRQSVISNAATLIVLPTGTEVLSDEGYDN